LSFRKNPFKFLDNGNIRKPLFSPRLKNPASVKEKTVKQGLSPFYGSSSFGQKQIHSGINR